jgi:hypothetical protein
MVFLAGFFWMGGRVTEMTIAGIGTIKTAVNLATQYIEDIKHIKADVEQQKEAIDAVAKAARTTDHVINELAQKNDQAAVQLAQVTEQLTQAKKLTEELQLKQDYWEVAKLSALGLTGLVQAAPLLVEHSPINDLIAPFVKVQPKFWVDCHPEAMAAYKSVIAMNGKFPFTYYYRGMCNRANQVDGWRQDFEKAKSIFVITTSIPGHNPNHDEMLALLEKDDLNARMPPYFTTKEESPR